MSRAWIGLTGLARSGKDTLAKILIDEYGYTKIAFADPLRMSLYALNPYLQSGDFLVDVVDELGWDGAKANPEVRVLMQRLGTEVGRDIYGADFWVELAIKRATEAGDRVVFTDCRFPNEAQAISACGANIYRIQRPGISAVNSHISERAMDDYPIDGIVHNDGDLRALRAEAASVVLHVSRHARKAVA